MSNPSRMNQQTKIITLNEDLRPSLIDVLAGLGYSTRFTGPDCCTLLHLLRMVANTEGATVTGWHDGTYTVSSGLFQGRYQLG